MSDAPNSSRSLTDTQRRYPAHIQAPDELRQRLKAYVAEHGLSVAALYSHKASLSGPRPVHCRAWESRPIQDKLLFLRRDGQWLRAASQGLQLGLLDLQAPSVVDQQPVSDGSEIGARLSAGHPSYTDRITIENDLHYA